MTEPRNYPANTKESTTVDSATAESRSTDGAPTPARHRMWGRIALGGLALASAAVGALLLQQAATSPDNSGQRPDASAQVPVPGTADEFGNVEPGQPCPGAVHATSISSLLTEARIWAPASGRPTDIWTCANTPVLLFGAVQISYETGWAGVDPAQKWTDMVRDYGGEVRTIQGRPAYVHAADASGPRNGVMLVVDGELIRLIAPATESISTVVDVANSLVLPPA